MNNDRLDTLEAVDDIMTDLFDVTDPENPVPKKLTVGEVGDLIKSLKDIKKESENNMSAEMKQMVDQLIMQMLLII